MDSKAASQEVTAQSMQVNGSRLLKVTFIDVGQGDSILVQAPSGKTLLVDGGPEDAFPALLTALKTQNVTELDTVLATHQDADHIGSLDEAIKAYPVGAVYIPKMPPKATHAVENFYQAVRDKGLRFKQAQAGVSIDLGAGVNALILAPVKQYYEVENNYSAVLKITYGQTSFLLMGDAEKEAEDDLLESGADLQATVLKVGHHGSNNASSKRFLAKVKPQYAVIEVGKDNPFGHPSQVVLNRLESTGAKVFRTDKNGTVYAQSDGKTISFSTNR